VSELRARLNRRPWLVVPVALFGLLAAAAAAAATAAATAAAADAATAAAGSIGVGIQAGPVSLKTAAHPGGSYQLPAVYVVNTGTQDESVLLKIDRISPGHGRTVPPSWVHVSASPVRLSHNQSASLPLQLSVPATAKPGRYFSDVVAHGSGQIAAGQANLGVAAATSLDFTVAPGVVSSPWFRLPAWWLPALGGLIVLGAAAFFFRVSGFRVRIERRAAPGDVPEGQEHADVT